MSKIKSLDTYIGISPKKNILIVEDEQDTINFFKRFLNQVRPEYILTGLTDPLKAIESIQSKRPDIILLDYSMPGLNGLDLLKQIQQLNDPPPVIFLTAHSKHRQEAVEAGAVDYFVKARLSWKQLAEKIDFILSEQHPSNKMFSALVARYKEELVFIQNSNNDSDILPVCFELTKEKIVRKLRFNNCFRDDFDLLDSLKDQLIAHNNLEPIFIDDPDILVSSKSYFANNIDMIIAQPLNITQHHYGIWLIFGLKSGSLITEETIPFFAHWAKYYEKAIEELYRIKNMRDHAVTMLLRGSTDLTRLGLSLGQLEDQSNELYEIRVELEKSTREINLLGGALKPEIGADSERYLSEITQHIVNKNKAWAEVNEVNISYEYLLNTDNVSPLLLTTEWDFVVNALLNNAIDVFIFDDVSEEKPQNILVRLKHEDGCVILDVLDNGRGINDKAKDNIFRQGWSTKGMHRGWGLFLTAEICQNNRVILEYGSLDDENWNTRFSLKFLN